MVRPVSEPRINEPRYPYVHVDVPADEAEIVGSDLWDLGATAIEERDDSTLDKGGASGRVTLIAAFADEDAANEACEALADRGAAVKWIVGDEWRDSWKAYFKPTRLGGRLVLRPSWEPWDAAPSDVVLSIDPGRAFGSGIHETTRLVLKYIDANVRGGEHVLDVGTGSGILSIAAIMLGAKDAVAVDNDPDVIAVVDENAALNGVAGKIAASDTPVENVAGEYDLVLANIEAFVLIPLAAPIAARVRPGGVLVLSGVLKHQREEVIAAYPGFRVVDVPAENEWIAIVLERAAPAAGSAP